MKHILRFNTIPKRLPLNKQQHIKHEDDDDA